MDSFNLRTASRKTPANGKKQLKQFRLEDHIILASSDKYNDAYECEVMARRIREKFVVSVTIQHDPVTTRVYSNSWIYNDMDTCWDKFHNIVDIVTDVRNFVEAEGLKSVLFQHMVKHSLSGISADEENIYESTHPTTGRQVIDHSTRGNLIKNFPTMPFRSQNGSDLEDVYTSVGNAENPIPPDGIQSESQYAIPQHRRKEMRLKDVKPCPISSFQEAAGLVPGMFKGASSDGMVKTAESKELGFISKVKEGASKAKDHGKNEAIAHYINMTGAPQEEAEAFYYSVKGICASSKVVLNVSPTNFMIFMAGNDYKPLFESPELLGKFNANALKREQAERAIGCYGLSPIYASMTLTAEGDVDYGKCAIQLDGIHENTIFICGDSFRFRNQTRPDYLAESSLALYPWGDREDCKATSIITSMSKHELNGGPAVALNTILEGQKEFGRCEALIFAPISPKNVVEVVTPSEETAKTLRKATLKLGKLVPIAISKLGTQIVSPGADKEGPDEPAMKIMPQRHFCAGDRVATKRTASQPHLLGTIVDISNGTITVDWDNQQRDILDLTEALMRIMEAPKEQSTRQGMVVYSLPGMSDETVLILNAAGVDPVSLYSIATHYQAPSGKTSLENVVTSVSSLGIQAKIIKGYVPGEKEAFVPKEWVEAKLSNGARLVIDIQLEKPMIMTGEVEEYIAPVLAPVINLE